MKILIALNNNKQLESNLSEHFGHCSYFAIYDTENKEIKYINNEIDHSNDNLSPVEQILKYNIDCVFTLGIGNRAIKLFKEKNIELKTGKYSLLKEVIENIDNLENINEGCNH